MTKASIVQNLLDQRQITAEEAVILLQEIQYQPPMCTPNTNPYFSSPSWTGTPPPIYCTTDTSGNVPGDCTSTSE